VFVATRQGNVRITETTEFRTKLIREESLRFQTVHGCLNLIASCAVESHQVEKVGRAKTLRYAGDELAIVTNRCLFLHEGIRDDVACVIGNRPLDIRIGSECRIVPASQQRGIR